MSNSAKRKRPENGQAPRKKNKNDDKKPVSVDKGNPVSGDALRWKEVSLSGRLEDAEGFYGLEEIEDVEVIKNLDNRAVMFRPRHDGAVIAPPDVTGGQEADDDWSGFEDDIEERTSSGPVAWPLGNLETEAAASIPAPKSILSAKSQQDDLEFGVSFAALNDIEENVQADMSAWTELEFSRPILDALSSLDFAKPTPIQAQAIPAIMSGKDVIGKAVTGSGKTLAFGIPILESWLQESSRNTTDDGDKSPLALILAPTRELAHQLSKHILAVGEQLDPKPRIATVTGGLSILKQQRQLEAADIVIGTPGRLWEVMAESTKLIDGLKRVKYLVVDEADRLLSEGHFKEVSDILDALDRQVIDEESDHNNTAPKHSRQTLVFSATFHKGLQQKLTGKTRHEHNDLLSKDESIAYLLRKLNFRSKKPTFIDASPISQMSINLDESIVECAGMAKDLYLYALMLQHPASKTLVFTNSISSVRRLTVFLQNLAQPAIAIHSAMPQKSRLRSLEKFASQRTILVATDVAARGLDIQAIDLILHYHVPRTADMYVHRSGRTARASASGKSILLCSPNEVPSVTRLISKIHPEKSPETIVIDQRIISRLQPRVKLSQKLAETTVAKEKTNSQDSWLRSAAEDLGVDFDSDDFESQGREHKRGRGSGNAAKQKKNSGISKDELAGLRAQLREELGRKINLGVSERYIAGGGINMNALLEGKSDHHFLGR